jgi:hypothetical protein
LVANEVPIFTAETVTLLPTSRPVGLAVVFTVTVVPLSEADRMLPAEAKPLLAAANPVVVSVKVNVLAVGMLATVKTLL